MLERARGVFRDSGLALNIWTPVELGVFTNTQGNE